jgi:hypothetical protein
MTQIRALFLCTAVAALSHCGNNNTPSASSVSITSPTAGMAITLMADKSFPVAFTTTNFVLMPPGSAGCNAGCGHVHLLIDGNACTPAGAPYNNDGNASPVPAKFSSCATATGAHTITIELHNNDHSAVMDSSGKTISASVMVTAS